MTSPEQLADQRRAEHSGSARDEDARHPVTVGEVELSSAADRVLRMSCYEPNVVGRYTIDARGGNVGDVTAPSGTAAWTGYATCVIPG